MMVSGFMMFFAFKLVAKLGIFRVFLWFAKWK